MTALAGKMSLTNGAALSNQPTPGHLEEPQMPEAEYKPCSTCGKEKPLDDFRRNIKSRDGRDGQCRACRLEAEREWRRRNPNKQREWLRANRARQNELNAEYKRRHREKTNAGTAVHRAVVSGELVRPSACEDCGVESRRIEAHHDDYSRPLDVRWLCIPCHKTADAARRTAEQTTKNPSEECERP